LLPRPAEFVRVAVYVDLSAGRFARVMRRLVKENAVDAL
jgi:hypothetical protein